MTLPHAVTPEIPDRLLNELSILVKEADLDRQMANFKRYLSNHIPVDGVGVVFHDEDRHHDYACVGALRKEVMSTVDAAFAAGNGGPSSAGAPWVAFATHPAGPVIGQPNELDQLPTVDGMAIPLKNGDTLFGLLFIATTGDTIRAWALPDALPTGLIELWTSMLFNSFRHLQYQEKARFFNLYETISSSLGYVNDLQELLTTIIAIITSELPSQEGSIMLYEQETHELEFFSVIGDTGCCLSRFRFSADKGIAGKVLHDQAPMIVNDVTSCPYFYGDVDHESGFVTQSILATPIITGEEKVGVIEAINKIGHGGFNERDKRMLVAIADEVGLAVKNAKLFDYVVNSYCKIRQGAGSCKGCVRPLKSWTPCARQLDPV